mmetsp:Transcript_38288/g.34141  ORF Transcript_38288/g.34141 Transcript_38288/m.34141 type:complete len:137 (-) Transcript_38288:362-772(-)
MDLHVLQGSICEEYDFNKGTDETCHELSFSQKTLRIEVIDTGIGISPEHLKFLLKETNKTYSDSSNFKEIDGHSNDSSRIRLGLSLRVTRKLVELMRGKMSISSVLGKGTSVVVTIPLEISAPIPRMHFRDIEMIE